MNNASLPILPQHRAHPRTYRENRYVYPVVSRRSKGISIGVNLNPDKVCNFDCIYCQVDRSTPAEVADLDVDRLLLELSLTLDWLESGVLFEDASFKDVPIALRRVNDIAFSGDGEPTTPSRFPEIVAQVAELKRQRGLDAVKLVLITNATMFHRPRVMQGLETLMVNNGEIWAKLDAGTSEYYHLVERTVTPFERIIENLKLAARKFPIVIQSLFMRIAGAGPSDAEIGAFIDRLNEVAAAGGVLTLVQVYTVARTPAEAYVGALANEEVDAIAERVRSATGIAVESYYGQ